MLALISLCLCLSSQPAGSESTRPWSDCLKAARAAILRRKYQAAEPILRAGIERARQSGDVKGSGACLDELAELYRLQNRYDDEEKTLLALIEERTKSRWPDHPYVIQARHQLVKLYLQLPDHARGYSAALPLIKQSVAEDERMYGQDDMQTGNDLKDLAQCYVNLKSPHEAEVALRRVLSIREKNLRPDDDRIIDALALLAGASEAQEKYRQAESLHMRVIHSPAMQKTPDALSNTYCHLARVYAKDGKPEESGAAIEKAISLVAEQNGKDSLAVAEKLNWISDILSNEVKHGPRIAYLSEISCRRLVEIYKHILGPSDKRTIEATRKLLAALKEQSKWADMIPPYEVIIRNESDQKFTRQLAEDWFWLGISCESEKQYQKAEHAYLQALSACQKHPEDRSLPYNSVLYRLGLLYGLESKFSDSVTILGQWVKDAEKMLGKDNPQLGVEYGILAAAYVKAGKVGEAKPLFERELAYFRSYRGNKPTPGWSDRLVSSASLLKELNQPQLAREMESLAVELKQRH